MNELEEKCEERISRSHLTRFENQSLRAGNMLRIQLMLERWMCESTVAKADIEDDASRMDDQMNTLPTEDICLMVSTFCVRSKIKIKNQQ